MANYCSIKQSLCGIFLLGLAIAIAIPAGAEVRLIANPSISADQVSATNVKNFFLGKSTKWDSGQRVICLVMDDANTVHEEFLKNLVQKTPSQFSAHWRKAVFTGTGEPPASVNSTQDMVSKVIATPGGLGYIDGATDAGNAKVLKIQ